MIAPSTSEQAFTAFRESLRDAAMQIVSREGIAALTLRQLASEVGCSRQTPYRYFRSKDELIEEVYVHCHDVFIRYCEDAVRGETDPREKLRRIRDVYLRFYRDEPIIYSVMFLTKPDIEMPRVAERAMYEHYRLRSFFEEAIAEGFLEGDCGALTFLFWNAIDGLAKLQSEAIDPDILNVEVISKLIEETYFPRQQLSASTIERD